MPQEITRTQIEKYTVYTGPTAESFSPIMITNYHHVGSALETYRWSQQPSKVIK